MLCDVPASSGSARQPCSLVGILCFVLVGGEFMPPLEEGNLWIRATLPQDISFDTSANIANQLRAVIAESPEVTQTVSQMGRPDDGTDVSTFNNIEISAALKPARPSGVHGLTKPKLIDEMNNRLSRFPGIELNFSQNIQDNVEEAMSGVKGENSLKLFGDDFDTLTSLAEQDPADHEVRSRRRRRRRLQGRRTALARHPDRPRQRRALRHPLRRTSMPPSRPQSAARPSRR